MANFIVNTNHQLKWQVGLETDIGGGRENQDDCFVWVKRDDELIVLCVLDGHGREVGKVAATSAKQTLFKFLDSDFKELIKDPPNFLIRAHEIAHTAIKNSFKEYLEKNGYEVSESKDGYLLKRRQSTDNWSCVHGGTSCSLVAIVNNVIYTANVGDSSAIICSSNPVFRKSDIEYVTDASVDNNTIESYNQLDEKSESNYLVITADHSPENVYEFKRLRNFKQREGDPTQPALHVVYDSNTHDKNGCHPVFNVSSTGDANITNKGCYYKNVRKEWASLVSTPSYAKFQDALAFTRSLGDLHLSTYGVTHLPEVQKIDLSNIFDRLNNFVSNEKSANSDGLHDPIKQIANSTFCIVLATDGVWDNWVYEDVVRFAMDKTCLNALREGNDGARRVTISFMQRNSHCSRNNFGNQADNATGILLYLSYCEDFQSL